MTVTHSNVTVLSGGGVAQEPGCDVNTFVKRVAQEIHKEGEDHEDNIKREMISAMQFYADKQFWFNQGTHFFDLTTDTQEYPQEDGESNTDSWPSDIHRIVNMYVQVGGTRWLPLRQCSIDDVRWLTPTSTVVGVPTKYAYFAEKIYLTPIPNTSTSAQCRLDYVKDLGIPRYKMSGGVWVFYAPDSTAPLADSYTNEWLCSAERLIRAHTKQRLYQNYYDDAEGAAQQTYLTDMELGNLMGKHQALVNTRRMPTYI